MQNQTGPWRISIFPHLSFPMKDPGIDSSLPRPLIDMNYVSAVVKAIEHLDENTDELIQSELVCLNYDVGNILALGIKKNHKTDSRIKSGFKHK